MKTMGLIICGLALFHPLLSTIGLLGIFGILIAAIMDIIVSKQEEKTKTKERRQKMSNLPTRYNPNPYDFYNSHIPLTPTIFSQSPESVIAELNSKLAADVLKKQSGDAVLTSLMNSSVATQFAAQGRGVRARTKIWRSWFTGAETTEAFVVPIDFD